MWQDHPQGDKIRRWDFSKQLYNPFHCYFSLALLVANPALPSHIPDFILKFLFSFSFFPCSHHDILIISILVYVFFFKGGRGGVLIFFQINGFVLYYYYHNLHLEILCNVSEMLKKKIIRST